MPSKEATKLPKARGSFDEFTLSARDKQEAGLCQTRQAALGAWHARICLHAKSSIRRHSHTHL